MKGNGTAMAEPTFRVARRLVVDKTVAEHAKFAIKDACAWGGWSPRGWREYRRGEAHRPPPAATFTAARLAGAVLDAARTQARDSLWHNRTLIKKAGALGRTVQAQIAPLLRTVLRQAPGGLCAEVGCAYAAVARMMRDEFPAIAWHLFDLAPAGDLLEANRDLARDGLEFKPCYALDAFEAGTVTYDAVVFNEVLSMMSAEQAALYLAALRARTSFVVFSEPAKILFRPGRLDVDAIPVDGPLFCGAFLVHNYRRMFARAGYRLLHYDVDRSPEANASPQHFMIRGVATPAPTELISGRL